MSASARAGEGHIPSAFSILDVLWVLYNSVLATHSHEPKWELRDRFVLSKGHGSLALYAVLAARGFFAPAELDHFAKSVSILGGHPDSNKVPGVEASTGSLGHGFPMAVGMALGLKLKASSSRVYVIIGDGECNEGSIWEAALLASNNRLTNLCCIVDHNHSGDRALNLGNLTEKFEAFGWECRETNGHDQQQIYAATAKLSDTKPTLVLANTIKGKGCAEMEGNAAWHHRAPSLTELAKFLEALS